MKKGKGKKGCIVFAALALLSAWLALPAFAIDAPLVSPKRLSMAAQVGADWRRPTNEFDGVQTKPAIKLVSSYSLYGPPNGKIGGSVALVAPVKLDLNRDHQLEAGVYLSVIFWSGLDGE